MNLRLNQTCMALIAILMLMCVGCSSKPESTSGGVTVTPSSSANSAPASTEAQADQVNACNYLSAADAQSIEGAPMQRSSIPKNQSVCRYDEVTPKPGAIGPAILSLTVNGGKSVEDENRHWANLKEVRHLQAGQKNVAVLSGLGDEAYFTGNTEKGKVGVASVIVRQGKYDFELDSMVIEYRASPEAMKLIAKRITGQLQ